MIEIVKRFRFFSEGKDMKKRLTALFICAVAGVTVLGGCGSSGENEKGNALNPGVYTGQSSTADDEEGGGYAIVKLTVGDDNKIENVTFDTFEKNGKKKFTENGAPADPESDDPEYLKMMKDAWEACETYRTQFLETGDTGKIDAISGATLSYDQFKEAVDIALQKASE